MDFRRSRQALATVPLVTTGVSMPARVRAPTTFCATSGVVGSWKKLAITLRSNSCSSWLTKGLRPVCGERRNIADIEVPTTTVLSKTSVTGRGVRRPSGKRK